jgi:large subunit ribosomal protein L25
MSEIASLKAEPRTAVGGRASLKLRRAGKVPAVVYGHQKPTVHIAVDAVELERAIRVLHARTFQISLEGQQDTVLIKDLQWDHLGSQMLHVDFERHSLTEKVKVTVPIELRNSPKTTGGGVLDQPMHQIHIECPFGSIPEAIRVDILNLTLGHPIHVRELTLPEGVSALDGGDMVVVQLKLPGAEPEPVETTGAEPEVLTAKKPKDGDEE